jgi:radical SAM superfamily enzyme YgiQ (UPF0313 family)
MRQGRNQEMSLDLLLIHPGASHGIYGSDLAKSLVAVEQPLWCRLIAGAMIHRGWLVKIIDAEAEGLTVEQCAERVKQSQPRLIGIVVSGHQPSASSQQMMGASAIANELFKHQLWPVVMLGNHPSALPKRTLCEEPVDFVCDGEGPLTLHGLLSEQPLDQIPGLVWWDDGLIKQNPLAPLLDMNRDLHGGVWNLLNMSLYRSHNWQRFGALEKRQPYASIHTSLGCSYKCNFCMINVFQHTNRYRMRDPKAVVSEMVMLNREYGVETFKFTDELFVLNRHHCEAICEGLIAEKLGDKISSWCYSRTDTLGKMSLPMFRRAGFDWFALGIESGSKRVRAVANKSLKNDDEIVQTVRSIEAAGINVISNFIFGLPSDDLESMRDTLNLALTLNTAFANFYCAMAYPGSQLYDEAIANGWTLPETWSGFSQHNSDCRPLDTEHISAADVLRFRDEAFNTYFSHPAYLEMVERKFGRETLEHVKAMTQYKLKRKLLEAA